MRAVGLVLVLGVALVGCGNDSSDGGSSDPLPEITLALDFTPNAVHAPIYAAVREDLDREAGVRLRIRAPGGPPDSLKDV
ncbi:MAG: hypothetical protein ABIO51_03585, partial [Solirubrobacteraceae bacterium]